MDHHVSGAQASVPPTGAWRKSSYSNPSGNCVEAAELGGGVALRDSRCPNGPALVFTSATWDAFLRSVNDIGTPADWTRRSSSDAFFCLAGEATSA
jgi:hypothetical protein